MARFALLVAVLVVAGCTAQPEPGASPTVDPGPTSAATGTPTLDPGPTSTAGDAPTVTPSPPASSPSATSLPDDGSTGPPRWEELAGGFDPVSATLVDPRTDKLLVLELAGRVRTLSGDTVLDLSDRVTDGGERGLLDATTTPDGQHLVVHYSGADGQTVLATFPVLDEPADGLADPAAEIVVLTFDQPAGNHNGGSVVFGPDGWLYFALGDGGRANDAFGNGADPNTPLGAILRLDVTTDPGSVAPASGNPFLDGGGDPRVWAHGLRNPWRITTDGDRWYVTDVGQDAVEELTILPADDGPHDLGWPEWEGSFCRADLCGDDSVQPVATLTHTDGACSIIGGAVAAAPSIDAGSYFYTDLCDSRVWRLDPTTQDVTEDAPLPDGTRPLALDRDRDGRVVALTQDGRVLVRTRT